MIQASAEFAAAIEQPSRRFVWRLLYNGIEIEGAYRFLSVHKGACSEEGGLLPGSVYASYISAVIDGLETDICDKELELQIGLEEPDNMELEEYPYEFITIGYFTAISSGIRKNAFSTSFTAGGRITSKMQRLLPQVSTASLSNIAVAITSETGVPVVFRGIANTSAVVEASIDGITCYEAIELLATMSGGYATESADGSVVISAYISGNMVNIGLERMNPLPSFEAGNVSITGVKVVVQEASEDEDGQEIPEEAFSYPSGSDPVITIASSYMTRQIFDNVYVPDLIGYLYRPGNLSISMGDPRIEPFDTVIVTDLDDTVYHVPCHEIVHTWDGGLMTTITAAGLSSEDETDAAPRPFTQQLERYAAKLITAENAIINRATIKQLDADTAIIRDIQIGTGSATNFSAVRLEFDTGLANTFTAAEITALNGIFDSIATGTIDADNITAKIAAFEQLAAGSFTADQVMAASAEFQKAMVGYLQTRRLDADYAKIDFANINAAAINRAWIQQLLIQGGFIASDGTVFNLTGVHISGDLIDANTVKADRLLLQGSNGLYYAINVDELGETTASSDPKYQTGIDGTAIIAHSITANQITAQNIQGTGGWINLASGTFAYVNATSGHGIVWDGSELTISSDNITMGELDLSDAIQSALDAAENTLFYDHDYLLPMDDTAAHAKTALFTAYLYRAGVDVKNETDDEGEPKYPPELFTWYYKKADDTRLYELANNTDSQGQAVNYGYTMQVDVGTLGYGGHIIGKFTPPNDSQLLTEEDDTLTNSEDLPITGRTPSGETVRVSDLSVSTTLYASEKLLVVGNEDEHLVTVGTIRDYVDKHYTHIQDIPSDTWTVTHNLNKRPSITVIDSAGTDVIGEYTYISDNQVMLSFSGAFAGKAYFN